MQRTSVGFSTIVQRYDERVEIAATHRANVVLPSQFFGGTGLPYEHRCLAVLIQKVVAMLAEIFMVRSEAEARLVEDSPSVEYVPLHTVQPE